MVPRDKSPESLQQPRLLARVADHDLITPPFFMLDKPQDVARWVKEFDFAEADGAIVSLDAIGIDLEAIKQIRWHRKSLPIFGFIEVGVRVQNALRLVADGSLDFLLISGAGDLTSLSKEIDARNLAGKVALDDGAESAAMMLVARMLNRRFGISPKLVPAYSIGNSNETQAENRRIGAKIRMIDGWELPQTSDAATVVDAILLFHMPRTPDGQRNVFVDIIERALEKGARVALVDLSENKQSKDALILELRRRKLLDRLLAYASSDPSGDPSASPREKSTGNAVNRAITHISSVIVALGFLRDDLARMRRIDNAQITLLFNRYLSDWAYPSEVRPALDKFVREELKGDPDRLDANVNRAAAFAYDRLKPIADELFNQQFRRNVHAILLSRGERVMFEISMIQRFQVRLSSPRISELEFLLSVYTPQINFPELPKSPARADWTVKGEQVDERIQRLIDSIAWEDFSTGAESVEVTIKTNPQPPASPSASPGSSGYKISVQRKKKTLHIDVTAFSQEGAFYAITRLEQMGANGKLTEDSQIAESPSFARRGIIERFDRASWSHRDRMEMIQFLGRLRMNRYYYAPKDDPMLNERWNQDYSGRALDRLKQLVRTARANFVELVYTISPGSSITYSSEADLSTLIDRLDAMSAIGITHFALAFEAGAPGGKMFDRDADRARFKTPAAAQAQLINRVYNHLKQKGTGFELTILPADPPNSGSGNRGNVRGNNEYLKELCASIPSDILVFWTAVENHLPEITGSQAREWSAITGRRPLIRDNFPANEDKSWRLVLGPKQGASPALIDEATGFIATPMGQLHASKLALVTAAQYAWDARGYDPARAAESALNLLYDERTRTALRVWTRVYGDDHHDANLLEPLFKQSPEEIELSSCERQLAELQKSLETIGVTRDQGLLRGELAQFVTRAREAIERFRNNQAYEKLPNGNYRLRK